MGMNIDEITSKLVSGAYPSVKTAAEEHANRLYETRKEVAASVCHTEHERETVIEAENVLYELQMSDNSYTLSEKQTEESLAVELVDEGKKTPVTKGPGGTATDITGEPIPAKSHVKGVELPELGWQATHFREETNTILHTTEPEIMGSEFSNYAQANGGEIIRPYITHEIQSCLGGDL